MFLLEIVINWEVKEVKALWALLSSPAVVLPPDSCEWCSLGWPGG